ncbi:MAG TPA: DNRLRE domain-containing protein [Phycisphaerae bacterium]|nr:DNRLRE domain-containing protein [Phycisphaerae bacterium]HOJ75541.1 DNRLRE domain-containing protein [Phycisphaerae bacterium]HOM52822.1 DNRLRE domain-containing protein [Phycisphaerae bacterium]HON68491.1 DNRLRE domain-containing protein [Phycisphaerae bacterium]HOQ85670.1 DNRLRE domain-containing protein [Phycisphaerae bacterium]
MSFELHYRLLTVLSVGWAAGLVRADTTATITVFDQVIGRTPDRVGYNLGHFFPGSNTADWWAYSGVNAARMWSNSSVVEPASTDDLPPWGDGVTDLASFQARRSALRADPLNPTFVNWSFFANRYASQRVTGNNMYLAHTLERLTQLGVTFNVAIVRSEVSYPWRDPSTPQGWADRWEHWQHTYAQAFYLARYYGVQRFHMFNEPDHSSHPTLTQDVYLQRLQFASDAIQCAVEDVNRLFGTALTAEVQAPVSAGGYAKFRANPGGDPRDDIVGWGQMVVRNRHRDYTGQLVPGFNLFHTYAYQAYNMTGPAFASDFVSIRTGVANESGGEYIKMALTEFNVHTAAVFKSMPETLDTPSKLTRMGSILSELANQQPDELYVFKFSQTDNSDDGSVKKNGVHYVANNRAPYNIGGVTKAGEVIRLFARAFRGAVPLLRPPSPTGPGASQLRLAACRSEDGRVFYLFSTNVDESSSVELSIDVGPWRVPPGTMVSVEEVSARFHGETVGLPVVPESQILRITQRPASVLLITIPVATAPTYVTLPAIHDAMVKAGTNANSNYGTSPNLWVKSNRSNPAARNVSVIQFDLGLIQPESVKRAFLRVTGENPGGNGVVIAHVYGIDHDNWNEQTVTWNALPNLGPALGADGSGIIDEISDNFILDAGGSAHMVGHLSADAEPAELMLDVTRFVQGHPDRKVSFLIAREVRFDGDVDDVNFLRIASKEDTTAAPPVLMVFPESAGPAADFDRDMDVDLDDFAFLQVCYTELAQPVRPPCTRADLTGDGFVDQLDVAVFTACMEGPNKPVEFECGQ